MLKKSVERDSVKYNIINLFDFLPKRESRLDDYPFGGGEGMIMKMEPIFKAYESLDSKNLELFSLHQMERCLIKTLQMNYLKRKN